MSLDRRVAGVRWLIVIALVLVAFGIVIIAGNQFFALKAQLATEPGWIRWLWWTGALVVLAVLLTGLKRALFPRRPQPSGVHRPLDEASLRRDLAHWSARGVDVSAARRELEELERRREMEDVFVAVHGEISAGKSSLIRALLPEAEIDVHVLGGTTRRVTHYRWGAPTGAQVVFADMPGVGDRQGLGDRVAAEEATRAHVVLFVADGDLARGQWRAIETLLAGNKPLVVALNKSDRYSGGELTAVRERLAHRLGRSVPVVAVRAGGREEVIQRTADGGETLIERERTPDVRGLRRALQSALDGSRGGLAQRRDEAVFLLTARKLEGAVQSHRRDAADALIERYARRAVIGALAAVAPGSDLVIQGALAVGLVRELCSLYRVDARDMAVDRLVAALRERTGTVTPLLLGVAGNALKAFPGIGTLTGGAVHAVAYGLLFRNVGKAVAESLEARGELDAGDALNRFEETLRGNLESPARDLATVVADAPESGREPADPDRTG